jgi:ABC-type phosphate/phosphonate transport system substrate-binding protein
MTARKWTELSEATGTMMREPQPEARWHVSLPIYNLPEMQAVNADFWGAIRHELQRQDIKSLPDSLDFARRPVPERIERDTLLTQVCGYPLQTIYQGQAVLLGAPVYGAEHCVGPTHTGVFVVHRESTFAQLADLRGCNFVYNSRHSNSGMNLPRRAIAEIVKGERFFGSIVETHSQPGNIERVARREVDATCVDSVTYAFFCRHRPQLGALTRVLAVTPPSPSIPFVTSLETPVPLQDALRKALRNVARSGEWAGVRSGLMLQDIVPVEMASYGVQLQYEREAHASGYSELK